MKKAFWIVLGTVGVSVMGCELVVDFDRSKIPQEGVDASTQDVAQPPLADAAIDVNTTTDAATDAATVDAATDGGTGTDAGSDATADADPDAGDGS